MSTKTISITEDAYERLRSLKKETERMSFSEVILKYYPRRSLETLAESLAPGRGPRRPDREDVGEAPDGEDEVDL